MKSLKILIGIICTSFILLLFVNCENDDIDEQVIEIQETPRMIIEIINQHQIESNLKVVEELENIISVKSFARGTNDTNNDFTVNTEYAVYTENENYHSYNFEIIRENPENEYMENLLLSLNNDGGYDAYIVQYGFTQEEYETSPESARETNAIIIPIDMDTSSLLGRSASRTEMMYVCEEVWTPGCGRFGDHDDSCAVAGMVTNCKWVSASGGEPTGDGEPADPYDGDDWSSGGDGLEGGGVPVDPNDPNDGSDGHITSPTYVPYDMQITQCLGLPDEGGFNYTTWLFNENTTSSDIKDIAEYLSENDCSVEAVDFAMFASEVLTDNVELDFETVVRLLHSFDKICQGELIFDSLYVNSPFVTNFYNTMVSGVTAPNNYVSIQDLPAGNGEYEIREELAAKTDINLGSLGTYEDIVQISFNKDYLDESTDLGIIETLYHEMLHALIIDLYHQGELLNVYPAYTSLKDAIDNHLSDVTNLTLGRILKEEMHSIYVDFIDEIAQSIVQYCLENDIADVDFSYAKKLVWGGLGAYNVFEENLTPSERTEALLLLSYEQQNHPTNAKSPKSCE